MPFNFLRGQIEKHPIILLVRTNSILDEIRQNIETNKKTRILIPLLSLLEELM